MLEKEITEEFKKTFIQKMDEAFKDPSIQKKLKAIVKKIIKLTEKTNK